MPDTAPAVDSAGIRFPPPLVYAGLFFVGYVLERLVPLSLVPGATWTRWPGWGLVAAGVALAAVAIVTFRRAGVSPNPTKPVPQVVAHGPFRLTRNPMYLAMGMVYLGVTLIVNSLWPLLLFPPVVWVITRYVIAREELYLERKFGPTYTAYRARVRRWL